MPQISRSPRASTKIGLTTDCTDCTDKEKDFEHNSTKKKSSQTCVNFLFGGAGLTRFPIREIRTTIRKSRAFLRRFSWFSVPSVASCSNQGDFTTKGTKFTKTEEVRLFLRGLRVLRGEIISLIWLRLRCAGQSVVNPILVEARQPREICGVSSKTLPVLRYLRYLLFKILVWESRNGPRISRISRIRRKFSPSTPQPIHAKSILSSLCHNPHSWAFSSGQSTVLRYFVPRACT
jgi:hypothetical protein